MANARDKFRKGDRVRWTDVARQRFNTDEHREGEVVGFGAKPETVAVIKDGCTTRISYPEMFWERVDPNAPRRCCACGQVVPAVRAAEPPQ